LSIAPLLTPIRLNKQPIPSPTRGLQNILKFQYPRLPVDHSTTGGSLASGGTSSSGGTTAASATGTLGQPCFIGSSTLTARAATFVIPRPGRRQAFATRRIRTVRDMRLARNSAQATTRLGYVMRRATWQAGKTLVDCSVIKARASPNRFAQPRISSNLAVPSALPKMPTLASRRRAPERPSRFVQPRAELKLPPFISIQANSRSPRPAVRRALNGASSCRLAAPAAQFKIRAASKSKCGPTRTSFGP
jgi:hypothetical protein